MKARPRSVENRVAEMMSEHFAVLSLPPVERIPVLGRTGPDISINAMGLVVDVKSRLGISKAIFFPLLGPFHFEQFVAVRLKNLSLLWSEMPAARLEFSSKVIHDYWEHMDEWTKVHARGQTSMIVLHRPEMPIGDAVALIHSNHRRRLIEYAEQKYTEQLARDADDCAGDLCPL